jgi:hypothetical protein
MCHSLAYGGTSVAPWRDEELDFPELKEKAMARSTFFRTSLGALLTLASSLVVFVPSTVHAQGMSQTSVTFQQGYQVALLQNGTTGNAAFLFATNSFNSDGTTGGIFMANIEGNLLQGRFLALNFNGESMWVAQAAGSDVAFLARGWKTQDRLVGDAAISLATNGQILRQTFFLYGQGVTLPAPATAQPPAAPLSAQPDTGPSAPNARPSMFSQP